MINLLKESQHKQINRSHASETIKWNMIMVCLLVIACGIGFCLLDDPLDVYAYRLTLDSFGETIEVYFCNSYQCVDGKWILHDEFDNEILSFEQCENCTVYVEMLQTERK